MTEKAHATVDEYFAENQRAVAAMHADEKLEQLAQVLGMLVFYDAPTMPIEAVRLTKSMLDLAGVQITMQMRARELTEAPAPTAQTPAPERRKRGRRPSRAASGNGQHPPAPAAATAEPPLFPDHAPPSVQA